MSYQHTHKTFIDILGVDVDCEVTFTVSPIIPASGPTYWSGGEPESGGEVEIVSAVALIEVGKMPGAKVERHDMPVWLLNIMRDDEDVMERLFDAARHDIYSEGPDPDAAYEAMRDERDAA